MPYLASFENIDRTIVMVHATGVEKFPQASGYLRINFEATVLDPSKDPARVWDALDDEVLEAIAALDAIEALDWTGAEPVAISNLFGWNITFSVPTEITPKD
ncbi:hypothetical protein DEJ17_09740 [Curtobacterium sp. MCSS17_011]|nr:hypothetical protein DEJ17_09740 [Curtobacterium sp. MCSS17_011]